MSEILVSFFSASGVTKEVANKIAEYTGGDLLEIEPVNKYTDEDLNWHDKTSRSSVEMADSAVRPAIKNEGSNISDYDTILIGFPIWWDLAPRVINTFIEENNFENKKVYVFATSGGSSITNSFNTLKNTYSNINFISAKRFTSSVSRDDVTNWII